MDERQFNEFENKLKNSDEHSQPAMNDFAWSKMEAKLDDAFGKKKKRRGLLWFFMLLAIMAGSGIIFYKGRPVNDLSVDQNNTPIVDSQKAQTTTTNQSINLKTSQPVLQASVTKNKKVIAAIFKIEQHIKAKQLIIFHLQAIAIIERGVMITAIDFLLTCLQQIQRMHRINKGYPA